APPRVWLPFSGFLRWRNGAPFPGRIYPAGVDLLCLEDGIARQSPHDVDHFVDVVVLAARGEEDIADPGDSGVLLCDSVSTKSNAEPVEFVFLCVDRRRIDASRRVGPDGGRFHQWPSTIAAPRH